MINGLSTQINTFRAQNNVPSLQVNTLGMEDAEMRAVQFAAYMAANTPGSPGFNPHQGYDTTAASIGYNIVSENLAYMTSDPSYIVYSVWQDSLHLAALLATDANVMGVSCIYSSAGTPYWTYEPGYSSSPGGGGGTPSLDSEEAAFLTLINNYRAQNGAGALQVSITLENASLWMSGDMAAKNYINHTDSLGRSTGTRLAAFNYPYSPWGENLAAGYSDAQSNFNAWLTACDPDPSGNCSYAHRQNMLNPNFKAIGIGRAYGSNSNYGWYWTTDFGGVVDQTIPTSGGAPTISSFSANPASINNGQSATLSWNVSGATAISIDNGIGDVSTLTSKTVAPSATTTYHLTATNNSGSTTAIATVTVNAIVSPPSPPTLTSATAKGPTQIDLTWTGSSGPNGIAGYQITRSGSVLTTVSGSTLSFSDLTVIASTTYTYSVKAYDAAGNYSSASNSLSATTPAGGTGQTCTPGTNAFTGCYYTNTSLSGNPALIRTDNQINFDWYYSSPAPNIVDTYSVRWQGNFTFAAGTYKFTATTSDGMRLYIDGTLLLDRWLDQPPYMYNITRTLSQGTHLIVVEYFEESGSSVAHLTWQNTTPGGAVPVIASFSASPSAIATGQSTTLNWSVSGATSISIDNGVGDVSTVTAVSVRPAVTTAYQLTAANAAGSSTATVTVTVNAVNTPPPSTPGLVSATPKSATEVDLAWTASTGTNGIAGYQVLRNGSAIATVPGSSLVYADTGVAPGATYTYSVKAFDSAANYSSASNSITVTTPSAPPPNGCGPATGAFTGCYYGNTTLSGNPILTRTDSQINFDWYYTQPAPIVPDSFSVRWQGNFVFTAGSHTFTAITSDGMRMYIDGNLVLDRWRDQPPYIYTLTPVLTQGTHLIVIEYYEQTGSATAHLSWQ